MKNIFIFIILTFISVGCITSNIIDRDERRLTGTQLFDKNGRVFVPYYTKNKKYYLYQLLPDGTMIFVEEIRD